jgi:GTP-binding protein
MKIKSADFQLSAPDLEACALVERRDLAKVSVTPGKTKLINFFLVNGSWRLVDLPGYGFARVGKEQRADFNEAVGEYIEKRENLACVFLLIDSNLPPQPIDLQFLEWLGGVGTPFVLVFTKIDRQAATRCAANIELFKAAISTWWDGEFPGIITCSSKTKAGRTDLLTVIAECLKDAKA